MLDRLSHNWHGSSYTFDRFDYSKLRDALGVFFTESRESAEYYAQRGGRFLNGMVRQYRLSFRNVLQVHQGEEYARCIARRDGETYRDVRRRLVKAGYDGVRVEYHDGGAVEYVAFSNRNIRRMEEEGRCDGGNVVQSAKPYRVGYDAVLADRVRLKGE